jgi:hypothetical protein
MSGKAGGAGGFVHRLIVLGVAALSFLLAGCEMPAGMNNDCSWPAAFLSSAGDRAQLQYHIRVGEELAMRYADSRGKSAPDYLSKRNRCEATLFGQLAIHHKISASEIANARGALDEWRFDPVVYLPVLVLCLAAALPIGRAIHRRFRDERIPLVVATIVASLILGWLVTILSNQWGGVVEMIRVGDTHMSYRAARIGWRQFTGVAFASSALLSAILILAAGRSSRAT